MPVLERKLEDPDDKTAINAAYALTMMDQAEPEKVIPILVKGLRIRDWNGEVQYRSAKALGHLGFSAGDAIPSLNSAARSNVEWVRDASTEALNQINPNSPSEGN